MRLASRGPGQGRSPAATRGRRESRLDEAEASPTLWSCCTGTPAWTASGDLLVRKGQQVLAPLAALGREGRERPRGAGCGTGSASLRGSFTPRLRLCVVAVRREFGGEERRLRLRGNVRNPLRCKALRAAAAATPRVLRGVLSASPSGEGAKARKPLAPPAAPPARTISLPSRRADQG